jgi:hypothetical protein
MRLSKFSELHDKDSFQQLLEKYGSYREIARQLGCAYSHVQKNAAKLGIKSFNKGGRIPSSFKMQRSEDNPVIELAPIKAKIAVGRDQTGAEVFVIDDCSYRIDLDTKRRIYQRYSNEGGGVQIAEIEVEFGIPRSHFQAIQAYWGLTHQSPIWPDEDFATKTTEELVTEGLGLAKQEYRRALLSQKAEFYEKEWRKAEARIKLEERIIQETKDLLPALNPPEYPAYCKKRSTPARRLIIDLSDWHVGKKTLDSMLVASPGFSTNILRQRVNLLEQKIMGLLEELTYMPVEALTFMHGDIVDNPFGDTYPRQDRGQDLSGYRQALEAVNILHGFLAFVSGLFKKHTAIAVPGNHAGEFDLLIAQWAADRLKDVPNTTIEIAEAPVATIIRGRNQYLLTHGNRIRHGKTTREMDIMQAIMMTGKNGYRKYISFGHLHHRQVLDNLTKEGTGYEWYLCPSLVGGDEYSEGVFWATSRPAQIVRLVDDEEGVLFARTLYLDE